MQDAVVFVTQQPLKKSADGGRLPPFDLTPAHAHGEVRTLFPPNGGYADPRELQKDAARLLADFNPARGDALILMGDPIIQAACVAHVSRTHASFTVLRYDRMLRRYMRATLN